MVMGLRKRKKSSEQEIPKKKTKQLDDAENKTSLIFNLFNVSSSRDDDIYNNYFFSLEQDNGHHLRPRFISRQIARGELSELVGYCNGLACAKAIAADLIAVVNPISPQSLVLSYDTPTGGYNYLCHGFGFDSLSQVYKVVMIFTSKNNDEFLCMVITLGTCSWRNVITRVSPPRDAGSSPFPSRMVTRLLKPFSRAAIICGGDLLWRTTTEVIGDNRNIEMLLLFDLHNEKIQFIMLPDKSTTRTERKYLVVDHLLEFKGYPCIARSQKKIVSTNDHCGHRCEYQSNLNCCCCCKVHMYVLKDKVKQVWVLEETFDVQIKDQEGLLPAPLCCYFDSTSAVTPPTRILTLSDQVLLYWFNGESIILYNLREKCLKVVRCSLSYPGIFQTNMNETLGDYQLHAQVESLVSMKTFIPKGAKTSKYDCVEDLEDAIRSNLPAGC